MMTAGVEVLEMIHQETDAGHFTIPMMKTTRTPGWPVVTLICTTKTEGKTRALKPSGAVEVVKCGAIFYA
jgi:hypothetical protein